MGELYHGNKFNANFEKSAQKCLASCDMCRVKFFSKKQVKQHKLYHMSQEFHNFWLTSYKNLPSYNAVDGLSLEFLGNDSKFWKYDKFKPTENNSVFKAQNPQDWELSWSEWDEKNRTKIKLEVDEKEEFPACEICGETFLHINTLKIHKRRNCLEEKPEPAKLKFRKPEIVSLRKSKSTKHKTLEEPEVKEKEEFPACEICGEIFLHTNSLTIHKRRNCLEENPEPPKEKIQKPEIVSLRKSKSAKYKTLEELKVEEKEELVFEGPTLTIHKRQNCLEEKPAPPKLKFKKPDIAGLLQAGGLLTLSQPGGAYYPHPVLQAPQDFQTLRRPCIVSPKKSKSMKRKDRKICSKIPLLPNELALDTEIQRSIANRNKVQTHHMFPRILKIRIYELF